MSRYLLPVSAKCAETESVILAAYRSRCGFLWLLELASWYRKLVTQTITVNILRPVREGPSLSQIMSAIPETGLFPFAHLGASCF